MSLEQQIRMEAMRMGVPPDLAVAVARRESGLDQSARGSAGEVGAFQLLPSTAAELGVDPFDTAQNIQGGIRYLKQQYQQFGTWDLALSAYNAGPGNVARGTIPSSTRQYVSDILSQQPTSLSHAGVPTFSTTVYSTPLGHPWWLIPALALLVILASRRRD